MTSPPPRTRTLILLSTLLLLLPVVARASSRQFNAFTPSSDQPPLQNPAVQTIEDCESCRPPTHAEPLLERGCATCPQSRLPPPLAGDCADCGKGDSRHSRAPFTTVTDTCADCEPFELHPRVGWCIDCDATGTGVVLSNGELFHRSTDADLPGRGFSLRFVRRHVSGIAYDGPLGKGWDFNYNMRLDEDAGSGDVTLWDGTGREDLFTEDSGSYTAPAGRFEQLSLVSGSPSQFLLTKPNGTEHAFEELGSSGNWRLVSITDRVGNQMTLSYDGSDRLATISDTLGRDVDFGYDTNDRISSITDFAGRQWVYAYTNGELTAVTTPEPEESAGGFTTSYAYTGGKLDTITDAKSQLILDATYNGSSQVSSLRYGDAGETFEFSYVTLWPGVVTVTDRNGNETDVTLGSGDHPTRIKELTNRSVRSGEGDYTTDYTFNSDGLLTRIDFAEGNAAAYAYASGTDDLTQEKLEDGDGSPSVQSNWTYTEDFHLVATYKEPRGHDNSNYTTKYYYDFDEATLGDLNGDSVTTGEAGLLVKLELPEVTSQTPNITPSETFRYNSSGQVTRWDHPDGEVEEFAYYSSGAQTGYLQTRVLDPDDGQGAAELDLTTTWTYDAVGNVATVTDRSGFTTTYTVNALNQVTKETIPISASIDHDIKYEHDANGNLTKREVENLDASGTAYSNAWITTSWTHETLNRVATQVVEIDATATATTTYAHDANRNLTLITKPEGNQVKLEWDERDLLYQRTRGFGSATDTPAVERRSWTGNRLLATKEFKHGSGAGTTWNTYTHSHDELDRLVEIRDPLGHARAFAHDLAGNVSSELGKEWDAGSSSFTTLTEVQFSHNEAGWLSKRTDKYRKVPTDTATDHDTSYEYRKDGQVTKLIDPRSNPTIQGHDAAGRLVEIEDAFGNEVTLTLDGNGNVTKRTIFDKAQAGSNYDATRVIDYGYDRRNLMTSETRDSAGLALTTAWARDSRGNVLTLTLPEGNQRSFTHDGRNLVLSRTEDLTASSTTTTTHAYDDNGNLAAVTDDNDNTTSYTYDDLDRRVKRTDADSATYTWELDEEDRVVKRTDENGTVAEDTLDALGRVIHRDVTLATGVGGPEDEDYEWDGVGRLVGADNDVSEVTLKWDSLSRVHEESIKWLSSPVVTRTVSRSFDATGNVTQLTYPDGSDIDYLIDADLDRIDQVKDGTSVLADYRYVGPFVDRLDYLNEVVRTTSHDGTGRVTEVDHVHDSTTIAGFAYGYDDNGNALYEQRAHDSGVYDVFEHDERDQLTRAYYDATTSATPSVYEERESFAYDGERNLTSVASLPYGETEATTSYTVNSRNQYTAIGSTSPSWTANGELSDDDAGRSFTYDWRSEIVAAQVGEDQFAFEFDALGRRITTDFGEVLRFTWAGQRILEEITDDATPSVNAVWTWGEDIEPLRMERGAAVSYYHANREGSVGALTDGAAEVVEAVRYSAHGYAAPPGSGLGNPFLASAALFDADLRVYAGPRSYDPDLLHRMLTAMGGSRFWLGPTSAKWGWLLGEQVSAKPLPPDSGWVSVSSFEAAAQSTPARLMSRLRSQGGTDNGTPASLTKPTSGILGPTPPELYGCEMGCIGAVNYFKCVWDCSMQNDRPGDPIRGKCGTLVRGEPCARNTQCVSCECNTFIGGFCMGSP